MLIRTLTSINVGNANLTFACNVLSKDVNIIEVLLCSKKNLIKAIKKDTILK
jgi:hypothetical protein